MRADAVRNRQRILDRAAEVFRASGPDASMHDVAEASGVGIGTLYRHFPDKTALVDAVAAARLRAVAAQAERLAAAPPASGRIVALLHHYLSDAHDDGALRAALAAGATARPGAVADAVEESRAAVEALIRDDVAAGVLRTDFSFDDFRAVCAAVVAVMDAPAPADRWERVREFLLAGIGDRPAAERGDAA